MPADRDKGILRWLICYCFGSRFQEYEANSAAPSSHDPCKLLPESGLIVSQEIRADALCSADNFPHVLYITNEQELDSSYVASSSAALTPPTAQASVDKNSLISIRTGAGLCESLRVLLPGTGPSCDTNRFHAVSQQTKPPYFDTPQRLLDMRAQVSELQILGRGGQAMVLRGLWQLADVAIKLVAASPTSTPASTFAKLMLEGPLSKQLRAPNVVETYCYSCTRLTLEDFKACHAVDEVPNVGPYNLDFGLESADDALMDAAFCGNVKQIQLQQQNRKQQRRLSCYRQGAADGDVVVIGVVDYPRHSFDSLDGFGSPCARRSSLAVVTYSDVLSYLGAAPGCYLTQIIMEFCDQGSLADAVAKGAYNRAPYDRMALFAYFRTLYDIAAGMSYLHSNGVIHGDLKPGNVLLRSSRADPRGYQAKVSDFGLSQCISGTDASSRMAEADWTSHSYMAPEHFDGSLVMASDVWMFAATAHHMWTGRIPHAGLHALQVCAGVCDGSLQLEAPANMPSKVWRLLHACMHQQWCRRPTFPQIRVVLRRLEAEWFGV